MRKTIAALGMAALLAGCTVGGEMDPMSDQAEPIARTKSTKLLEELSAPKQMVDVAVYEFADLTGQYKPNESFAEYSRAVTQGADAILVDVLLRAGKGSWFNVVERRGLQNLLRERQVIQATRAQFLGDKAEKLPPLVFAGTIIEGGVVAYETNTVTGGVGARYLGIGGDTQYRSDVVTVNLRLVSVKSGRVISSVTTTKRIYSLLVRGSVFKFIGISNILEIEAGFTRNSPPQLALREAIEFAVYSLIMDGAEKDMWAFSDEEDGKVQMGQYKLMLDKAAMPVLPPAATDGAPATDEEEFSDITPVETVPSDEVQLESLTEPEAEAEVSTAPASSEPAGDALCTTADPCLMSAAGT